MAGENYDWLTRGLEPEVTPEYIAQKLAMEEEQRRRAAAIEAALEQAAGNYDEGDMEIIRRLAHSNVPTSELPSYVENYQFGGTVPRFGGQTMNGISMGPPRRPRPNMMQPAIGMKAPVPTFPMPQAPKSGITMGGGGYATGNERLPYDTGPSAFDLQAMKNLGLGANPPPPPGPGATSGKGFGALPPPPGSTDTVPAMLTPGEGVLNRGAMGLIGEAPVNALNRMGRGYAEGGTVEDDGKYQNPYPTFEDTRNWTEADWAEWRRRHPRFESPSPTPEPEYLGGGTGRVGGRGGGHDYSGYDFDNPLNATPHGTGGLPNIGFYGGTMSNPTHWMDPNSEKGGPMPSGMRFGPWGAFNPMGGSPTDNALYGLTRKRFLDKIYPTRGNPSAGNLSEGGIVPGYAEGTPSVEIDAGPMRSTWQQWLDIRNPTENLGGAGPSSFRGFQHQFQNRQPPPYYPPGTVPGETLGPRDRAAISGGPGYGWAPTGGPGWSPFPGAGAGTPGMGGSLNPLAGMPSQGFNWKPFLDKMFPGRTQAAPGVESGGIVMEGGVTPSFQEGTSEVHPIGYVDPIKEQEWQKIIAMLPSNVDPEKLRKQAESSGISPQALAGIASMFTGGMGGGGGDAAAVSSLGAAFGGGV